MGQTQVDSKGEDSGYNINKCFHWKFYSWGTVIHIIAALVAFVALVLGSHDSSICIGLDPNNTQHIPVLTAAVFSFVWQAICPTQPKWFERSGNKNNPLNINVANVELSQIWSDAGNEPEESPEPEQKCIVTGNMSLLTMKNESLSIPEEADPEEVITQFEQTNPSQNWIAFYASFPKYHCAAYNSLQALILPREKESGRIVLLSLYILQSVAIIVHHVIKRSKDWSHCQDFLMGVAIWLNFTAITIFQHQTAEYLFGGVGCLSNVIPVAVPMLVCFIVSEFGTSKCLKRYSDDLASTI